MTEPAPKIEGDALEQSVDDAISVCDGDIRAALRAALVYNQFLERKLAMMRGMVSSGYTRGRIISPARAASQKMDDWREMSAGTEEN